jgi:small conductance mechanosensitive channel
VIKDEISERVISVQDAIPFYFEVGVHVVSAALIIMVGWMIGEWLSRRIKAGKRIDKTLGSFLGALIKYAILMAAFIAVLGQFGVETASLLALLGGAALAVGLAIQGTLSNVAAGTMLLILRPFKVGDYITFGNSGGTVKSLGLFGTELSTVDNIYIFAPNSQIWGQEISNFSRNLHRRQDIVVGIGYDDDISQAFATIHAVLKNDKRIFHKIEGKQPDVVVDNMGDFSIEVIVRFWGLASNYQDLKWDITRALKEALDNDGISIPFPTQVQIVQEKKPKASPKKQ